MGLEEMILDIEQSIDIDASGRAVFEAVLGRFGPRSMTPEGQAMPLTIEPWPGGRWFRDLGDGVGHLWGFVQVIKPPTLLELQGPMFMSYPVSGHLQIRVSPEGGSTRLSLRHRALGLIEQDHRQGVEQGWGHYLKMVKQDCS